MCIELAEENSLQNKRIELLTTIITVKDSVIKEKDIQIDSFKKERESWIRTESTYINTVATKTEEVVYYKNLNRQLRKQNTGLKIGAGGLIVLTVLSLFH